LLTAGRISTGAVAPLFCSSPAMVNAKDITRVGGGNIPFVRPTGRRPQGRLLFQPRLLPKLLPATLCLRINHARINLSIYGHRRFV
jgi:hypothetical protein